MKRLLNGTALGNVGGRLGGGPLFYGAVGVLAVLLVLEWLPAAPPPPVKPLVTPHVATADNGEADARDTGEWADTILARPLFVPGRKPPRTTPGQRAANLSGLPRLSGIMITGSGRRAIFAPDGGKPLVLGEGANLDDSTIKAIHADRVIITGPKGEIVLRPTYARAGSGGTSLPGVPSFQPPGMNPGFPNPVFNPGFNPGGAAPGFQLQPPPPPPDGADGGDDAGDANNQAPSQAIQPVAPQPFPGPHGPSTPRERE